MGTHPIFESDFDCLTEMVRSNSDSFGESTDNSQNEIESKSSKLYRTLLISGSIKKPEQVRMKFQAKERSKFWKKSKDEIERCFGSKVCKMDKCVVLLKSEPVITAIDKLKEKIYFEDTHIEPTDVILNILLQCILFGGNKLPKDEVIEIFVNLGFIDSKIEPTLGGKKVDQVLKDYQAGQYLVFTPSNTVEKGKKKEGH